ncbi:serine/threonine-protein kinase [Streptomyces sp. NPDC006334]|uniref:serine/threonine-protein kinase n=1 Tax=Streptomyces sp. NPDC006334 TaxID=3156754 RepID=UPI0033ADA62A
MEPGRVLGGRYRVHGQVGSGGYGRVWRAYDEVLQVEVTLEAMGAADAAGADRAARSLRAAARNLRGHPGVITVDDVVEAGGVLWAVVPFVAGPSLADHLAEHGAMSVERVRRVASQLLDALEAMHEAGIVHGDVRPANVRLDRSRWVLLPGAGALTWADPEITRDGAESVAVADYIAPEVVHGFGRRPNSDLFSLGATLYHLVAGHAPFQRDSVMATLWAVVREDPPPLGRIGGLELLIEGLLVKDPERRLTVARAQRMLSRVDAEPYAQTGAAAQAEPDVEARAAPAEPGAVMTTSAKSSYVLGVAWGVLAVLLPVAAFLTGVHASAAGVSDSFVTMLPWVIFVLGVFVLAVQVRAALTRCSFPEGPLWRGYVRSLAPPASWDDEERDRRRAAAEQAVDEALLMADRRVAAASQDSVRGASDV